jgi:putative ABC transport system permease protein
MRVPLLQGREFSERDDAKAPHAVLINDTLARRYWPGQNAVGKHLLVGRLTSPSVIIGVLGSIRNQSLTQDVQPEIYVPLTQYPSLNLNLIVRTNGDPHSMFSAVRERIHSIDKDQPVTRVQTMEELLDAGAAQPRLTTWLLAGLSLTALTLAIVGIYGVIACSVAERTQEMGIRIALGAARTDILRIVLRQGFTLAIAGIAIGIGVSLALARVMGTLLYQVSATDPLTYIAGPGLFAAVALLASYLPARRATRVDPMIALRAD